MSPRVRLAVLVAAVAGVAALAAVGLPHHPAALHGAAQAAGVFAVPAAVLAWVVLTPALFPGTVLAAACGLAFGAAAGSAVACVGATLGALGAFALSRRTGRAGAEQVAGERWAGLRAGLERRGFAAVFCARMAPGVPATALNYVAGLSRVRARHFAAGIALGGAPRQLAYATLGAGAGGGSPVVLAAGVGLLAAASAAGAVVAWRMRPRAAQPAG